MHMKTHTPPPAAELVNAAQLAERIHVSLRTVADWKSRRLIPFVKVGKSVRFNPARVIEVLESNHGVEVAAPPRN